MATRTTQRRTSTPTTRAPRTAGRSGTQAGRSGTQAGRFGRTSSSSSSPSRSFGRSPQPTSRFGRTPAKTSGSRFGRSSKAKGKQSGLAGVLSSITSAKAAPKPGAKGAGGLLAAAAAAGLAWKNRDKVAKMNRKRDADPVIDGQPQTVPPAV